MADFRDWGRVEHIGPQEFFVIASAVPESSAQGAAVLTCSAGSLDRANLERSDLTLSLGATVRSRSDRVVDVE